MRDGREEEIRNIVGELLEDYKDDRTINQIELFDQPDTEVIVDILLFLFICRYFISLQQIK